MTVKKVAYQLISYPAISTPEIQPSRNMQIAVFVTDIENLCIFIVT
jgi:hypothetical protein